MIIFSTQEQIETIVHILKAFSRLPFFVDKFPGEALENIVAYVRKGEVLNTYDFVDVVNYDLKCGWQIKSTRRATPVTWKRAKIPGVSQLIEESFSDQEARKMLGDAIISFCNSHVKESIELYELEQIGYARLILNPNGTATYFEKLLCSGSNANIFQPDQFNWRWSLQKETTKKEQLRALHGFDKNTNKKWWAWHGLGENQLHFSGENYWWPSENDTHQVTFELPPDCDKLTLARFIEILLDEVDRGYQD